MSDHNQMISDIDSVTLSSCEEGSEVSYATDEESCSPHLLHAEDEVRKLMYVLRKEIKKAKAYRIALRFGYCDKPRYKTSQRRCEEIIDFYKELLRSIKADKRRKMKRKKARAHSKAPPITAPEMTPEQHMKSEMRTARLNFPKNVIYVIIDNVFTMGNDIDINPEGVFVNVLTDQEAQMAVYHVFKERLMQWCTEKDITVSRMVEHKRKNEAKKFEDAYNNDKITQAFFDEMPDIIEGMKQCKLEWQHDKNRKEKCMNAMQSWIQSGNQCDTSDTSHDTGDL
jgi:hypothetical protein